jgi:uncharacterized protein YigA (DUF484 family)
MKLKGQRGEAAPEKEEDVDAEVDSLKKALLESQQGQAACAHVLQVQRNTMEKTEIELKQARAQIVKLKRALRLSSQDNDRLAEQCVDLQQQLVSCKAKDTQEINDLMSKAQ